MVDYFSFEDVMRELELSEEDLKRMVSEGELRAFRDENKMKFKRDDVEHLKKGRITEPTIILPSTPGGGRPDGRRGDGTGAAPSGVDGAARRGDGLRRLQQRLHLRPDAAGEREDRPAERPDRRTGRDDPQPVLERQELDEIPRAQVS